MRRWLPWLVGLASVAAVVFAALHFAEARDFVRLAERASGWWLLAALALQASTYVAQGEIIGCVGRGGGFRLSQRVLYPLSLAKLFLDQAVPSAGLSGSAMMIGVLEGRDMPRALISTAVVIDLVSCWSAYALGLGGALLFTTLHGEATPMVVLTCVVFMSALTILSAIGLTSAGRPPGPLARRLARVRLLGRLLAFLSIAEPRLLRRPGIVGQAIGYQLVILALDTATVWVLLRAVGAHAPPGGVFASFMISTVFRTVESLPGGLGVFEASSVLTLKLVGVPVAAALSATLLFRGLSFWLPMAPGLWLSRRALRARRSPPA